MSLNLTLHDEETGEEIFLWQTPTWVTEICLSYDPVTKEPDGGQEGVRRRYIRWIKAQLNGIWHTEEELETQKEKVEQHLEKVNAVKRPHFSYV